jgi:hypothetical protein
MQAGSSDTFEELFTYACPKFVSPAGPDFSNPGTNSNMEAFRTQLRWVVDRWGCHARHAQAEWTLSNCWAVFMGS